MFARQTKAPVLRPQASIGLGRSNETPRSASHFGRALGGRSLMPHAANSTIGAADHRNAPPSGGFAWDFGKIAVSSETPVAVTSDSASDRVKPAVPSSRSRKCAACEVDDEPRKLERELKVRQDDTEAPALAGPTLPEGPQPVPADAKTPADNKKPAPAATCPAQVVTMSGAECGSKYGAVGKYCFAGAKNWWFKEAVKNGPGPLCQPGNINQTTQPIQSTDGCVADEIFDFNGPPKDVAPCTDTTFQTVFTGPTKADVEKCKYSNTQVIEVTVTKNDANGKPAAGKVITTSGPAGAGVSTSCNWTA